MSGTSTLSEGDTAPDFTLPRDGGTDVTLSDLKGDWVVLYFYPKDDTPGCTTEALDFTALKDQFAAKGAQVFGISKDSVAKHDKFCAKHGLGIPLLSDAQASVCEAYGVWGEKKMYGKSFEGITRTSVLIKPDGTIARIWPKVKVAMHAAEVLDAIPA
ncbi:Putative peroxiredoxin bcp [Aquimixticola soesokkakensis]|uniref:thioredoxin-dependent peroxiredoxin n=1 Tax=Aquimixticola soesokkakensis TaxID=1519096 RepID=A0A1Y5SNH8_9RHOB|nr:thioredoxin-dependent thiol peroxidase [Aquimixticola soesokkakensis]SLN44640.1 Putative peroxiredoxin bcp [Aquimixticola soesokkakensis]